MKRILCFLIFAALLCGCGDKCKRSHKEICHRDSWVQYIIVDKSIIPITHPSYDYECVVCDEYAD